MAVTKGSDNEFPSVLFVEQGSDPATPAAGTQRLFVDTDGLLKLVDDTGTVTRVGFANPMTTSGDIIYGAASGAPTRLAKSTDGKVLTLASGIPSWATPSSGFSDPMTTRGDVIVRNASNVTARLAIGSSGKVLSSDGTDVSWQTPSGGSSLSYVQTQLAADVTLSSTNTFFDGPAVTLSAGTWYLSGQVLFLDPTGTGGIDSFKLWDGTTVLNNIQHSQTALAQWLMGPTLSGVVVVASGTPTWKISAATNGGTDKVIRAAGNTNISGNVASILTAIKIV